MYTPLIKELLSLQEKKRDKFYDKTLSLLTAEYAELLNDEELIKYLSGLSSTQNMEALKKLLDKLK